MTHDTLAESFDHNGYTIEIHRDEYPSNPRDENDNLGTLHAHNRRYDSRDKGSRPWDAEYDDGIALPVSYCYHDGTLGTCDDDMADGYIYVTRNKILREYSCKRISAKVRATVLRVLEAELSEYNAWASGEVYGYIVRDEGGNDVYSCWGYYGDLGHVKREACNAVPNDAMIGTYAI